MAEESTNFPIPNDLIGKGEKITYTQLGFRSAQKSQSNPEALAGYLEIVYNKFLEEQKLDEEGLKKRIAKLRSELQADKEKRDDKISEIRIEKGNKDSKEKEIEELELDKIKLKKGDSDEEVSGTIPFVIASFITLLLTLYLFVFYSSSGFSAFYGIKPGSLGFIVPDVFTEAGKKGPAVVALIILFPVIFLGLGFLIHDALDKNEKFEKAGKKKRYGQIIALLSVTFLADVFIGYKIAEGVYINQFHKGEVNEVWNWKMVFSDINFYLVIILGFVVYIIWGFLLHFVLGHPYLKTQSERVKLLLENLNKKIADKNNELTVIKNKIIMAESAVKTLEDKISEKQKEIFGFENGNIPINTAALKGSVGEFMGGWQNYTIGNFNNTEAKSLNDKSIINEQNWVDQKLASLNLKSEN